MPTSYRDTIAPTLGVVASAAILSWWLYPEQPELTGDTARQEQQPGYRAGGPDCLPAEIANLRGRERARRAVTCQEAEEQYRLTANDLIQQRRAADAADASAVLTYQQTRIAAWGVFLGFVTMAAAIAAAWFARRAAVATEETVGLARDGMDGANDALAIAERNAEAAAKQVAVSEDTAKRQLRAYVVLAGGRWYIYADKVRIEFHLRNSGVTPATKVRVQCVTTEGSKLYYERYMPESMSFLPGVRDIASASEATYEAYPRYKEGIEGPIQSSEKRLYVVGRFFYEDIYGMEWSSEFLLGSMPDGSMIPLEKEKHQPFDHQIS